MKATPLLTLAALCCVSLAFACATTQPTGKQVSDAWITSKIESQLTADPEVNPFEIDVDTQDGVVRLSGLVEEETDRQEAEQIAGNTEGVKRVINDIEIGDLATGTQVSDAGITSEVKAKLIADPEVRSANVDVDTTDGVVTLSGLVRTDDERQEIEELARNTEGVRDVRNLLDVQEQY